MCKMWVFFAVNQAFRRFSAVYFSFSEKKNLHCCQAISYLVRLRTLIVKVLGGTNEQNFNERFRLDHEHVYCWIGTCRRP